MTVLEDVPDCTRSATSDRFHGEGSSAVPDHPKSEYVDPYVVLGVDSDASPDEIEAAYTRRGRLHDPEAQASASDRTAAERYHAELADAYRALLGTAPPEPAPAGAARTGTEGGGTEGGGTTTRRSTTDDKTTVLRPVKEAGPTPGRDVFVVLGTLVAVYVVVQVPVAAGLGVTGLVVGFLAALALVTVVLVHERGRRT